MRILFLASRFPRPPFKGDQVRTFHQLRLLKKHDVTLITFAEKHLTQADLEAVQSFCKRVVIVSHSRTSWLNLARSPFTTVPLQALLFSSREYARAVDRELRNRNHDVVHAQLVRMCAYAADISCPRVVDFIDALSVNMRTRAVTGNASLRPVMLLEARRVQKYERAILETFDEAIVVSHRDRAAIDHANPRLHVIPNGVDPGAFDLPRAPRDRDLIIFTGTMNYFANVEAAKYLVYTVLPLIRKTHPKVHVQVVGSNPARSVRRLAKVPGVEVTGSVRSVFPYLQRAAVAVCPMWSGSGMQNKVLEAMAVCTPVVTTPHTLQGIEAENGVHLLSADNPSSIADCVRLLLDDPDLAQRIGSAGGELARIAYTWERSVRDLERVYTLAIGHRAESLST